MESNLVIALLTIAILLLSAGIIGLLVAAIVVVVKMRHVAKRLHAVAGNAAKASDWLSPAKLFHAARRAFHK